MELNSFDVSNLIKEIRFLVNGKIENIYQTDNKNIYLQIYIKDKPKQLLRIISGKAFFITKNRPEFPENLMRFCSFLRKFLINSKIKSIEQLNYERIIKIVLEKQEIYELYIEFFGKGNIVLTLNNKILAVLEEQIWSDRKLVPNETYVYPKIVNQKEIFERQMKKGSIVNAQMLDETYKEIKKETAKDKELKKIKVIIEKQSEQLGKALAESSENKRKGELIYEKYQELQDLISKIDLKNIDESKLNKSKIFRKIQNNKLVVDVE